MRRGKGKISQGSPLQPPILNVGTLSRIVAISISTWRQHIFHKSQNYCKIENGPHFLLSMPFKWHAIGNHFALKISHHFLFHEVRKPGSDLLFDFDFFGLFTELDLVVYTGLRSRETHEIGTCRSTTRHAIILLARDVLRNSYRYNFHRSLTNLWRCWS